MVAQLLRDIREEVIGLLFNRYVFRTHQEIVRRNPELQGDPRGIFCTWAQAVYVQANAAGVRRLASASFEEGEVNFVRLLEMLIGDPGGLWPYFERLYPEDAAKARAAERLACDWKSAACRRLMGEDRKALINAAEQANRFASRRTAHSVPTVEVTTTFSDLDESIDTLKGLTEKYSQLLCAERREALEDLHGAGDPTVYLWLEELEKNLDVFDEMTRRKLPEGWKSIFLEPWATRGTLGLPLGEIPPPKRHAAGT